MNKSRNQRLLSYLIVLLTFTAAAGAVAHHSNILFDQTQELEVRGVVTDFQWNNPHCYIQLQVEDEQGNAIEWSIEMAAPMYLYKLGWRPSTLKAGDIISVTLWPLKNGEPGGLSQFVADAEGKRIGREP